MNILKINIYINYFVYLTLSLILQYMYSIDEFTLK